MIGEPQGRDTAAAVGLAALLIEKTDPGAAFCLLPADHVIADSAGFRRVLSGAFDTAEKKNILVTIGIRPDFPSTGYGYLKGDQLDIKGEYAVHFVERFVEKPNLETASGTSRKEDIFGMLVCLSGAHNPFFPPFINMPGTWIRIGSVAE